MSINYLNVTVVGQLGKDPEVRSTGSGKKVASFSIPIDQGFGDNKKTEWVNIVAWGREAEFTEKYLKKGKPVGISGTLQTRSWDDPKTGEKRYKTEVVARSIDFVDSGGSKSEDRPTRQERATPAPRQQAAAPTRAGYDTAATDSFSGEDDDSIPF